MTLAALRAVLLVVALVAAGAGGSRVAAAEEPVAAEAATAAREHHKAGVTHYDLAEYGAALEEFKAAYRAVQDPSLLFNIAQCHRKLGQRADALSFYRSYLRRSPEGASRAEAERHIRELEREVAGGAPAPPSAAPAPATPATATPPAIAPAGEPAPPPPPAPAGVALAAAPTETRVPVSSERMSNRRVGALVIGGAGLLAIGIGSAVALSARSTYDDTIDRCPGMVCGSLDDKNTIDGARSRGDVATIIWIGGLAALATGTVLWVTEPPRSSRDLAARPMVGPGVGGVVIAGTLP